MKCLIIGSAGQLGHALVAQAPQDASLTALPRDMCDLTDAQGLAGWLNREKPDIIFNAAAYTAVDAAEDNAEAAERINAIAVVELAKAAADRNITLVQVSTDFVFDGTSSSPYEPGSPTRPLSVYGRTKRAGEIGVQEACSRHLVVRTAWVYAETGRNFVRTMLRLMAERDTVRVVADQIGTPTYAGHLAHALWGLVAKDASGLFHYTDSGVASWYDFAVAIQEEALAKGILKNQAAIIPVATKDYPTPATRPRFSVLDKSSTWPVLGWVAPHWRVGLRKMLEGISIYG